MTNLINVVVIDPVNQEVRWESINNNGDPKEFADVMGCNAMDSVNMGEGVIMYVDDNGLLYEENRYFSFETEEQSQSFAGVCILAICDNMGNTLSFDRDIGEVRELVKWKPEGYKEEPFMAFVPLDDNLIH
jgi:hypothetical protein|tara:strand:- start:339 stop:731 length:393 start_codon:yes stop_codon:yes gene_type:complete